MATTVTPPSVIKVQVGSQQGPTVASLQSTMAIKSASDFVLGDYTPQDGDLVTYNSSNGNFTLSSVGSGEAIIIGQAAFEQANLAISISESAYHQANTANVVSKSAYVQANTATTIGQAAFVRANSEPIGTAAYVQANTATIIAQAAYTQANTGSASLVAYTQSAYNQANTATTIGQAAFARANSEIIGTAAYIQANTATTIGQAAFARANSEIIGTAAYVQANTATTIGQAAFVQANTANTVAIASYVQANTATTIGQAAFNAANTRFSSSGGTITGNVTIQNNLTVTGNLTVIGSATTINTSSIVLNDSLLYLANNNYVSDAVDIGIIGHYNDGVNAHTGIFRDPARKEWVFFKGYTPEVESNNVINISDPSFSYANVYASVFKGNLAGFVTFSDGTIQTTAAAPASYSSAGYSQANTSVIIGQAAYVQANTATTIGQAAFARANSEIIGTAAYVQANTATTIGQSAYGQANTSTTIGQAAYVQANTSTTIGQSAYGQANTGVLIGQSAYGQANTATTIGQSAYGQANTATTLAQAAFDKANTGGSGGSVSSSGYLPNSIIFANNAGYLSNVSNVQFFSSNNSFVIDGLTKLNYTGFNGSQNSALVITGANTKGGIGYLDFLQANNTSTGATNPNKYFRLDSTGQLQIINSAYSLNIFNLTDAGTLSVPSLTLNSGGGGQIVFPDGTVQSTAASGAATDQTARNLANTANNNAQSAFNQSNTSLVVAQASYTQANTATTISQSAYGQANTATTIGQSAFARANSEIIGTAAYVQANTATTIGQASYVQANTANTIAIASYVQANAAYNQANTGVIIGQAAFVQANTANTVAISGYLQANNAYNQANTSTIIAQAAFARSNSEIIGTASYVQANSAYNQANAATIIGQFGNVQANNAYNQANVATIIGQAAYGQANTATIIGQAAYGQANVATIISQAAFADSNTRVRKSGDVMTGDLIMGANIIPTLSNTFYLGSKTKPWHSLYVGPGSLDVDGVVLGNSGGSLLVTSDTGTSINLTFISDTTNTLVVYTNSAYYQANTATIIGEFANVQANNAYDQANTATIIGQFANVQANNAYDQANTATIIGQFANVQANNAYNQANTATIIGQFANVQANNAYDQANTATVIGEAAYGQANTATIIGQFANVQANNAYNQANTATIIGQTAYEQANTATIIGQFGNVQANNAYDQANTARTIGESAYATANLKFNTSGGTITGNVTVLNNFVVTGNLTVIGSATTINTSSIALNDPLLYLANNNYTSDAVDIGIIGHYNDGVNAHTGVFRDPARKEWIFFQGYTPEVESNNIINIAHPSFAYANVYANVFKGLLSGNVVFGDATTQTTAAAPSIYSSAAYNQANNATTIGEAAFARANSEIIGTAAYVQANTATIIGQAAYSQANIVSTFAQASFDTANLKFNTSGGTITGSTTINANLIVSGANVALGNVGNIHIYGGNTGQLLSTDSYGNLQWIDLPTPNTVTYTANSLIQTNGVYVSGNLWSTQVFGDYASSNGAYVLTDGTGTAPAWYIDFDFLNVVKFNRVVLNINYTQASGHTVYIQLYNNDTSIWDSIGTYTGLGSYYAFALEVINEAAYVNSGRVQLRLYHSNAGNSGHQTSIDYVALEQSFQGPQGPRGPTGSTGSTGATGNGVATGGTTGQVLIKNSSTNYDTSWSNNLIDAWNAGNAAFIQANTATTIGQAAFDRANSEIIGTAAYVQANTATTIGQSAYVQANTATVIGESAYVQANTATTIGQSAYNQANTATTIGEAAFARANSEIIGTAAYVQANNAYNQANTATTIAHSAFDRANSEIIGTSAYIQANNAYNQANTATIIGQAAYEQANTATTIGQSAYEQANSALMFGQTAQDLASVSVIVAESAYHQANDAYNQANTSLIVAQAAYAQANIGGGGATYSTSNTAPISPKIGDQWYYPIQDVLYEYTNDGFSNNWVDISGPTLSANIVTVTNTNYYSSNVANTNTYVLTGTSTGNNEIELFLNGINNSRLYIANNTTIKYDLDVAARRTDSANGNAGYSAKGVVVNNSNTVFDLGLIYEVIVGRNDTNYNIDARANTTLKTLNIYATGNTAHTVKWVAIVTTTEVSQ